MKKNILLLLLSFLSFQSDAQLGQTISVNSRYIIGPCGDTLLLKGVNYAPYNWGWSNTQLNIDKIAQSGSNVVRLIWYKNPSGTTPIATYGNLTNLDSALSKCVQNKLIPIVSLQDQTCQNDPAALIALSSWFTQPAMLALINKYKHSLMLNIANEALYVNWTGNPTVAQTTFVNTYNTIVTNLRASNIKVPLIIDGPECGTNLDVLASIGNSMQTSDPQHNLIFSAHAYWYAYASNDSLTMLSKINNALTQNIPFIFGEIANQQDDATNCQYTLNYKPLLNICKQKKIGWLAWSWDNDVCPNRQITTNGNFSSLTAYGIDIVNNTSFGLLGNPAAKSQYLTSNGCNAEVKIFIQGYYNGSSLMKNVLYLEGLTPNPSTNVDTVVVELHKPTTPFNLLYSYKGLLQTNGKIVCVFPSAVIGQNFYICIKHRNTIQTWSANAVTFGLNTKYDFSTAINKAYGSNQKLLSTGIWGIYNGDLAIDNIIDNSDFSIWETDASNFVAGYSKSDINGDGIVDNSDFSIWEQNANSFVGAITP
jgi:mannan endo-1,4-beta-mannosidase